MSILVNADEHRDEILKAAHRRAESTFTTSYVHRASINQHARGGGVREAGSGTNVHVGNQRARYGGGAASRPLQRASTVKLGRRMSPKVATGAALATAGAFGVAHHRKNVEKSAAGAAGRTVREFKRGAQRGVRLAGKGHTHTGQIGSGVAGRPTFSVRSGMPAAGRAGIHAGVLAGNAPTLAAGAAVGAGLEHRKVHKGLTNGDVAREVLATPKPKVFGKKRDAAERTRARGVLANPKVSGAEDDYWLKGVSKSAFGVELGKALGDDNSVRGAVRGNYVPPTASVAPVKKIKLALGPAKSALIAAAKK